MKYFKKLISDRLYLSPMNLEDIEYYVQWINDLEISLSLTATSEVYSIERERKILEKIVKKDVAFAIVDRNNDNLIGNVNLHDINYRQNHATLGIFIGNKSYWNKGYGTEAIDLILSYGFYFLNLHNIKLEVFSFNERAITCYKKLGFKEIGRRREAIILGGTYYDDVYMDILSHEFDGQYDNFLGGVHNEL